MEDRLKNMDSIFHPRSIAFVGATETVGKWGFIIFNNILAGGYEGKLYPVNPGRDTVQGIKAYPTVRDIPGEVDLAVFTVPAKQVVQTIDDCVAKGVKAGVIISAGFKEMGGENADLEKELVAKARAGGMVLVGPNGQGVCGAHDNLYAWMPFFYPPKGRVGVVSQSGNVQNMLVGGALRAGFGPSKAVSSGNEADLKIEDYFEYFAQDETVDVIISYIEGLVDGRRFFESARAATKKKPVVVIRGGRTKSGTAAAASHTGAMAVSEELFEAACKQAGVTLVRTIEEAGLVGASFINRPLPRGKRVGILTGGGGLGVVAADECSDKGLEVVTLSDETLSKIGELMPDWWVPGNPVDMVAGLRFDTIGPIIEILMRSGEVDSIMFLFIGPPQIPGANVPKGNKGINLSVVWETMTKQFAQFANTLFDLMIELKIPIFPVTNRGYNELIQESDRHISAFQTIDMACTAISEMVKYQEYVSS